MAKRYKRYRNSRATIRLLILIVSLPAAGGSLAADEDFSAVFGPGESLTFDHVCARQYEHAASTWAVFAGGSAGGLALTLLQAGWVGAQDASGIETAGVALFPLRVRIARPPAGPDDTWRLVFRVGSVGSGPNGPSLTADGSGAFSLSEADADRAQNIPNGLALPAGALADADVPEPRLLALAARSTRTGEEVVLRGPEASGLAEAMRRPKPVVRVLGLFDILNPAQRGGLFDTIARGVKFDRCVGIRKSLLRRFEQEVRAGRLDGAGW